MRVRCFGRSVGLGLGLIVLSVHASLLAGELPKEMQFGEALTLAPVRRGARVAFPVDPVAAQMASGEWRAPKAGDTVSRATGSPRTWEKLAPGKDGSYQGRALNGGYAFFSIPSDKHRVMVLEASGHGMVWVNGEPRAGDPYSYGYVHVPVELKEGSNDFLFSVARGELRAKLVAAPSELFFNTSDVTLPDLIVGQKYDGWAAVPVINATPSWQTDVSVSVMLPGGKAVQTRLAPLPPLSVSKVPIRIVASPSTTGTVSAKLELHRPADSSNAVGEKTTISLRVLKPEQTHKVTFRSKIDGSVQYYAVVPATPSKQTPGLTLTLHGAGVEGSGQAACFTPKSWTHVVAATNRRPYGFDWEDWGRLDALEVLDEATHQLKVDPHRRWLTGHSMGGHGTWHLGVTFPDKFAAIGPSAGWISMMSYAGVARADHPDPLADLFQRAASAGDTMALVKNLSPLGVYVLHGDQDDNVPVEQAREMRQVLAGFHGDWAYHERLGAGHWWGNPCVDWPEMFEFFSQRTLPEKGEVKHVRFVTASPAVSAECEWAIIQQQQKAFKPSSIDLTHDREKRTFVGKTENVGGLGLDVHHLKPDAPIHIELDGQKLADVPWPGDAGMIWLDHTGDKWRAGAKPTVATKTPARSGPFRNALRNEVLFVVGTKGSAEENAWALRKARFDAENFWYRGNGYIQVVLDSSFDPAKDPNRNVVLYGNADTNAAWSALLGKSPMQVTSASITIGGRETKGDHLGCLFVRPRPGSDVASVGAVSGTGVKGMRLTDRLPFFVSGVGYPDCVLFGPDALIKGMAGVKA
ncbi:MAG TPA: prolyl oligopeptidase family serine peptidase, partial [Planctomycetaceae bacterium]|nr:prolyl oligopeptidase family serine peptidase [Planctomycetaceae bacterium]